MKKILGLVSFLALLIAPVFAAEKGAEPAIVAHGERIDLTTHLVAGKTTVVDFTSKYCPPCRAYDEPLKKLHAGNPEVAVVKVDINRPGIERIDWKSPVSEQFGLKSIPHFKVYDGSGNLIAEGDAGRAYVNNLLEK